MMTEYYISPKWFGKITPEELAVIRGCLLNGALPWQVYEAFDELYSPDMINDIRKELVENGRLKL